MREGPNTFPGVPVTVAVAVPDVFAPADAVESASRAFPLYVRVEAVADADEVCIIDDVVAGDALSGVRSCLTITTIISKRIISHTVTRAGA